MSFFALNGRRDRLVSFILSIVTHFVLLVSGGIALVRPAEFGVEQGLGGVDVYLVAAPSESAPPVPEVIKEEKNITEEIPEETIPIPAEMPVPRIQTVAPAPSENLSSDSGKDSVTFSSGGGAQTMAEPTYLKNPAPSYPLEARKLRQEGVVILTVDVDRSGNPSQVLVRESSGYVLLDESALKAVKRWKFLPSKIGNLAIESKVEIPVRFQLED